MADATAIAIGTGLTMWFADKVFGKAIEPLGESLIPFLSERWRAIAGQAEGLAKERLIEPTPISPGLLARMIMDASFSADEPGITE